ncbi:MAG: hypothetical protein EXQ86_07675 [Rhodospirillales bacterium]|nr:hypothetical protein [Rhodospirillales bacterium]
MRLAILGATAAALVACSGSAEMPAASKSDFATGQPFVQFPDIPMPSGAKMEVDKTLIVGSPTLWYGQLVMGLSHDANSMFDFYKQELPKFGWNEITSVRAPVSLLTYARAERVIVVQIRSSAIRGSEIMVTVSPRESSQPMGAGGGTGGGAPAPSGLAPAPVQRVPLRQ